MSDISKTISISYEAKVNNLIQGLQRVSNVSEKEARKMVSSLEKAYRKAEKDSEKASRKQRKELEKISKKAKSTGKAFDASTKNLAIGFAGAGVAVLAFSQQIADLSNQLVDASTKTGVAVDTLAGLRLAAEGSGLSFENLEVGLIKLPTLMDEASKEGTRASKIFKRLGVSVTETQGDFEQLRSADVVLKDVFKSLQSIESAEQKAAAAASIFGQKAGPAFIQSGAIDNLDAFMELANEFGVSTGPEMQTQMATFQRVASTALTVVQGEMSNLLNTAFGEAGINGAIVTASEFMIGLGMVATQQIQIMKSGFTLVTGIVSNAWAAITGGDAQTALQKNNENLKEFGNQLGNISTLFERIETRQEKFRKALKKTLETPIRPKTPKGGLSDDEKAAIKAQKEADKEALEMAKAKQAMDNLALTISKDIASEDIKVLELQAQKLKGEEKINAVLNARIESIKLARKEYNANIDQTIENMETTQGLEKELSTVEEKRLVRNKQFTEEAQRAREDAQEQKKQMEERNNQTAMENHQKRMDEIAEMTELFATVADGYVSAAALSADLLETFGQKNKKNAEMAFNIRKGAAIAEIAINTAVAVTRALAELGPVAGGFASGGIVAVGAAQIALVAAEKPKFHMGGLVGESPLAPDERQIIAKRGEAVLSTQAVQSLGGSQAIQAIENGATTKPIIVVTNPFKHYDRFIKGRRLRGIDTQSNGRLGY